jgi:Ulp1 protease family, C-terminal catalytic domain
MYLNLLAFSNRPTDKISHTLLSCPRKAMAPAAKRRKTRKAYPLPVNKIGRCRKTGKSSGSCLPDSVLRSISPQTKKACPPGADHCILDNAGPALSETERKQFRMLLRPRYPNEWKNDPDAWLDNFQIDSVMKQYAADYPSFKFLGVFPMDFSAPDPYKKSHDGSQKCLSEELCNINLKQNYAQGFRGIGAVFNLDPHFKSGSHWVGLYININHIARPEIYYFDSYGMRVPRLIARLMKSFKFQNKNTRLAWNSRRFQFSDSECGMYSMYFLISMLSGVSFEKFCHNPVPDKEMYELRKILFSN